MRSRSHYLNVGSSRRAVALVSVVAILIAIAGPTASPSAQDMQCAVEARGALPSRDSFHGDGNVTGDSDLTGNWFHVSPSARAALVRVTLDELICTLNGSTHATLEGRGRWRNQQVQFLLFLEDGGEPPAVDSYRLIIHTPEAGEIYRADDFLSRGDVSVVAP